MAARFSRVPAASVAAPIELDSPASERARTLELQDLTLDSTIMGLSIGMERTPEPDRGHRSQDVGPAPPSPGLAVEATPSAALSIIEARMPSAPATPNIEPGRQQTFSPPRPREDIRIDASDIVNAHFGRLLEEAQRRRDLAVQEAERAYEEELHRLVEEKERLTAELTFLGAIRPAILEVEAESEPEQAAVIGVIAAEMVVVEAEDEDPLCGLCYDGLRAKGKMGN